MAIAFPLTMPTSPGFTRATFKPQSIVGANRSPSTGEMQIYAHPGQWSEFDLTLPPMNEDVARLWAAFLLTLNGPTGTFYFAPPIRLTSRGTPAGSWTVGAGAAANSTTLPIAGGTGAFAVGDWLQIGATSASVRLHRVLQLNAGSLDVFPVLRSAYANGTTIIHSSPVGVFRLKEALVEEYDEEKICMGMQFSIMEAI